MCRAHKSNFDLDMWIKIGFQFCTLATKCRFLPLFYLTVVTWVSWIKDEQNLILVFNFYLSKSVSLFWKNRRPTCTHHFFDTFLDFFFNSSLFLSTQAQLSSNPIKNYLTTTLEEIETIHRLFLVNCYLLHVPRLPSQQTCPVVLSPE